MLRRIACTLLAGSITLGAEQHLERKPIGDFEAVQMIKVTGRPSRCTVAAPIPPDLPSQKLLDAAIEVNGSRVKTRRGAKGRVLYAKVKVNKRVEELEIKVRYRIRLYERNLSASSAREGARAELSRKERKIAIQPTRSYDFDKSAVRKFLASQELRKSKTESDLEFARRAFLHVRREFSYVYPPKRPNRSAADVFGEGASDCGGLNGLLVAILRANDVPARVLVGRHAYSSVGGESLSKDTPSTLRDGLFHQYHVCAEFHDRRLGWVPVDAGSGKKFTTDEAALRLFGRSTGRFVTMHIDHDVEVEPRYGGTFLFMQGMRWWTNKGSWRDRKANDPDGLWTVTEITPAK